MKIVKFLFAACFLMAFSPMLEAYDGRPACYKELERNFFSFHNVGEALALWKVPQAMWDPTIKLVQERQKEAESVIEKKARLLKPNPLEHPFQSDVAGDLLKQTMYEIFQRCLLETGFFDTVSILKMFEYIWAHDPRLSTCLS